MIPGGLPALLAVRGIAVTHGGRDVLDVDDFSLSRQQATVLLGKNGCGKSTLIRVLGLLVPPTRGTVWLDGEAVEHSRTGRLLAQRRRMVTVLQEPLLCRMSVFQNAALGLRFRRLPGVEIARRVEPWLERLRIGHLRDRQVGELSGGEAQRVSLARGLSLNPEILLLDEPFSALDTPTRQDLLDDLREVLRESRITTAFATHDRGEALALGHRVAILIDGRIGQIGTAEEVFAHPKTEEIARFVGVDTLIPGTVVAVDCGLARIETKSAALEVLGSCAVGDQVLVSVRPEEITLHVRDEPTDGQSARNRLRGTVVRVVPDESLCRVEVDCGVRVVAAVTRPSVRALELAEGRRVQVTFKASAAHLIRRP